MLGLGLGLNRSNLIISGGGVDPIIAAMQLANATLYVDMDKATGTSKGVNSPFTDPVVDLIGSNDIDLVGFAETTADGYDEVSIPAKADVTMLKGDVVNSYGVIADNASLDPTGTEDFAICGVFKTSAILSSKYLFARNLDNIGNMQYSLLPLSNGGINAYMNGVSIGLADAGTISINSVYEYRLKRISSVLSFEINEVKTYNEPNTDMFVSTPYFRLFCRNSSVDGITQTLYGEYYLGYLSFFYNGATGLNETNVDNACALAKAKYF